MTIGAILSLWHPLNETKRQELAKNGQLPSVLHWRKVPLVVGTGHLYRWWTEIKISKTRAKCLCIHVDDMKVPSYFLVCYPCSCWWCISAHVFCSATYTDICCIARTLSCKTTDLNQEEKKAKISGWTHFSLNRVSSMSSSTCSKEHRQRER